MRMSVWKLWASCVALAALMSAGTGCSPESDSSDEGDIGQRADGVTVYHVTNMHMISLSTLWPYRFHDSGQRCIPENAGTGYDGTAPVAFDFAGVNCSPGNVTSADLKMYATNWQSVAGVTAYPLLVSWNVDSATWFDRAPGVAWNAVGARGATDIGPPVGQATFSTQSSFAPITVSVTSYVVNALTDPSSDHGLLLRSMDTNADPAVYVGPPVHISSELETNSAYLPVLDIACADGPPNSPPTVSLTSPVNNASVNEHSNVILEAVAADADGSVSKVEFFDGATKLGEDVTSPYAMTWNNVGAPGNHVLTAKATDNSSATTTSTAVNLTVINVNEAPVITAGPLANPSQGTVNQGVNFSVTAIDPDAGDSLSYVWNWGDGSSNGNGASASHTYATANTYTVTVTVTDSGTLSDQETLQFQVNEQSSQPTTVTFRQGVSGYAGTKDVEISTQGGLGGWNNNDGSTTLSGGLTNIEGSYPGRGLIRFDVSSISSSNTVTSAKLRLRVTCWNAGTLTLYYLAVPWRWDVLSTEINSSTAKFGWTHRDDGVSWNAPGALGTGDIIANTSVVKTVTGSGDQSVEFVLDPALVQLWVSSGQNYGVSLFRSSGSASASVKESEDGTVTNRPELEITYQ